MLAHDVAGEGPALLLVHEGIADRRMWEPQVGPFVDAGYQVVRCDLRGFGETPMPAGTYSNVEDVRELLAHLGLHSATLIGGSLGARVAVEYALTHPDSVDALVLMGPGLRGMEATPELERAWEEEDALIEAGDIDGAVEVNLRTWVDGPSRTPDEVDPAVRELVRDAQRRAFDAQLAEPEAREEPFDSPAGTRLGDIRARTLILVGALDQPSILNVADRLVEDIPGARKVLISGTAHIPNLEKPDEFNRLVLEFLKAA